MVKTEKKVDKKQEHTFKKKPNGKNATGRPTDYKEEYCKDIVEYFEQAKAEILVDVSFYNTNKEETIAQIINPIYDDPKDWDLLNAWPVKRIEQKIAMNMFPSFVRFARKIWVNKDTLYERAKNYKEFSDAMKICNEIAETILLENWLQWIYNAWFTQFLLKNNYWYKDKSEVDNKVSMEITDITPKQQSAIESLKNMFIGSK